MTSCGCARPALTSLTFGPGIVLLRCSAHEAQSWVVDGREAATADALASLRTVFVERRGQRQPTGATGSHPRRRRTDVPAQPARPEVVDLADPDARLTALLQSRGIAGSWTVA